jgi:hypothetical protein
LHRDRLLRLLARAHAFLRGLGAREAEALPVAAPASQSALLIARAQRAVVPLIPMEPCPPDQSTLGANDRSTNSHPEPSLNLP